MRDVMALYHNARVGDDVHLYAVRASNPPAHLWAGVQLYATLMARNVARERERQQAEDKRKH